MDIGKHKKKFYYVNAIKIAHNFCRFGGGYTGLFNILLYRFLISSKMNNSFMRIDHQYIPAAKSRSARKSF